MPDRLATELLLLARDPATGRLRRPRRLDIGLRAALFADLLLDERIADAYGSPLLIDESESGDRVLDSVARAVGRRPKVAWWRWFRHVRADRDVLVAELVDAGRWTPRRSGMHSTWDDADALDAQAKCYQMTHIVTGKAEPPDAHHAALCAIAAMCGALDGRPKPRALGSDFKPLLDAVGHSGEPGAEYVPKMILGASRLSRRPMRR